MAKNKGLSMSNFGNDMEQQECALLAYKSVCTWHNYFEKLKFQLLIYLKVSQSVLHQNVSNWDLEFVPFFPTSIYPECLECKVT